MTSALPARSCKSSTFWVIKVIPGLCAASRASARWAGGRRLINAVDKTVDTLMLVFLGLASFILAVFIATAYTTWLSSLQGLIQKEVLEATVNLFTPLSIIAAVVSVIRFEAAERDRLALLLAAIIALGSFSGAMFKFYAENTITDPVRVQMAVFAFFVCLTLFSLILLAYAGRWLYQLVRKPPQQQKEPHAQNM